MSNSESTETTGEVMTEDLTHIKTYPIKNKIDVYEASCLTKRYCLKQIRTVAIQSLIDSDRWSYSELLSDVYFNPKDKADKGTREIVGFVSFIEVARKAKPSEKILAVRYFAAQPYYDSDNLVKWVKYRMNKLMESRKCIIGMNWPVDEYDRPLQDALKENGFTAIKTVEIPYDAIYDDGDNYNTTSRILFTTL